MALHIPRAPHMDFDEHPLRVLPVALVVIVVFAVVLIVVAFALAKWLAGQAY